MSTPTLPSRRALRRLQTIYRSAGWPAQDDLELELLHAGWVQRHWDAAGRCTLHLSDSGIAALLAAREQRRARLRPHRALVEELLALEQAAGRRAYSEVHWRVLVAGRWLGVQPDVWSIRHCYEASRLAPVVYEAKVRRADLLADLRRPEKRAGYQALCERFYYVLRPGLLHSLDEIPADCGVMELGADGPRLLRESPRRAITLSDFHWLQLLLRQADDPDPATTLPAQAPLAVAASGPHEAAGESPPSGAAAAAAGGA